MTEKKQVKTGGAVNPPETGSTREAARLALLVALEDIRQMYNVPPYSPGPTDPSDRDRDATLGDIKASGNPLNDSLWKYTQDKLAEKPYKDRADASPWDTVTPGSLTQTEDVSVYHALEGYLDALEGQLNTMGDEGGVIPKPSQPYP